MKLTKELEAEIRRAVNPVYVNQRGSESYERAALLGEIDRLRAAINEWVDARNAPITGMFGIAERDALIKAEDALEASVCGAYERCARCDEGEE